MNKTFTYCDCCGEQIEPKKNCATTRYLTKSHLIHDGYAQIEFIIQFNVKHLCEPCAEKLIKVGLEE